MSGLGCWPLGPHRACVSNATTILPTVHDRDHSHAVIEKHESAGCGPRGEEPSLVGSPLRDEGIIRTAAAQPCRTRGPNGVARRLGQFAAPLRVAPEWLPLDHVRHEPPHGGKVPSPRWRRGRRRPDVLRRLLEEHGDEHAEYLDLPSGSLQIVRRNLMPVDVVQPGWVVDVEGGPGPRGG